MAKEPDERQEELFGQREELGDEVPLLYVAMPLSQLAENRDREHVELLAHAVSNAITAQDIVDRWLARRRATICDGPRRRLGRRLHLANVQERLDQAWKTLSAEQQEHVIGTTRIARGRIERILGEPLALAAASVQELLELQAALRIESDAAWALALPDLRPQQRAALNSAAQEFGWNFEQTLGLYERARRELARRGVRRLPLASNRDWEEFRRDGI